MTLGQETFTLRKHERKLTLKYWELRSWLKNLPTDHGHAENGGDAAAAAGSTAVTTQYPAFFPFKGYNLWEPNEDLDEDRIIAQEVWKMQQMIKKYNAGCANHNPTITRTLTLQQQKLKGIFVGNMDKWPKWVLPVKWRENKQISNCNDELLGENWRHLSPVCRLVDKVPSDWPAEVNAILSFLDRNPFLKSHKAVSHPASIPWFKFTAEPPHIRPVRIEKNSNQYIASYWSGATISRKYAKWIYYDPLNSRPSNPGPKKPNYAEGKSKMAAIIVSNCHAANNRLGYVAELQKYVDVDVYGKCGTLNCTEDNPGNGSATNCLKTFRSQYRFYLAFENCNCRQYITEKLYRNAFRNDLIPIVMGASPADYAAAVPRHSYIHVDDFASPASLASYMHFLSANQPAFNRYFEWREAGEFVTSSIFCRLCYMLDYMDDEALHAAKNDEFDWTPDRVINDKGEPLCLPNNTWHWNSFL